MHSLNYACTCFYFVFILFTVNFHNILLFDVIVVAMSDCSCAVCVLAVEELSNETVCGNLSDLIAQDCLIGCLRRQ